MLVRLCPQCKKRKLPKGRFKCGPCKKANAIAHMKRSNAAAKARRHAAPPKPPTLRPCKCGCGAMVEVPKHYSSECSHALKLERDRKLKAKIYKSDRIGLKPHRPDPPPQRKTIISEEEQARLDAEASRRDREWNKRFFKETLGLESPAPGKPLASKVVTPPPEVFQMYQEQYSPQRNVEREFHIPLRADISYN